MAMIPGCCPPLSGTSSVENICSRASGLVLPSGVFRSLLSWKGAKGEGEEARCRYGVRKDCEMAVTNRLCSWSLVLPAWEQVRRTYPPLTE